MLDPYTQTAITGAGRLQSPVLRGAVRPAVPQWRARRRFDDDFGRRDFTTVGVLGGLTYDNRDNPVDATEGYFLEALAEPFYEFNYGNAAVRMTAEGRTYYGFGEENRIVRGRPAEDRRRSSARRSTRRRPTSCSSPAAAARCAAMPTATSASSSPDGAVTGGRSLIEGSVELRVRVTDTIGVVAFADAGYVGADSFPDFAEEFKVGVGAGLRYLTGLGPIRLDAAFRSTRAGRPRRSLFTLE